MIADRVFTATHGPNRPTMEPELALAFLAEERRCKSRSAAGFVSPRGRRSEAGPFLHVSSSFPGSCFRSRSLPSRFDELLHVTVRFSVNIGGARSTPTPPGRASPKPLTDQF